VLVTPPKKYAKFLRRHEAPPLKRQFSFFGDKTDSAGHNRDGGVNGILSNMQVPGSDSFDPMTPLNLQELFSFFAKPRKEKPLYWSDQYSF
jgi:hypothetical protein